MLFKVRIVLKLFSRDAGVDYLEIFSPIKLYKTVRFSFSICLSEQHDSNQSLLDGRTFFFKVTFDEEIFVSQPEVFLKSCSKGMVYLLEN